MKCSVVTSLEKDTAAAVEEITRHAAEALGSENPDLAMVFISPHHAEHYELVAEKVRKGCRARILLGCSAEGIIGSSHEFEGRPALSLWLARLPGVELRPFHVSYQEIHETAELQGWPEGLPKDPASECLAILLADPVTFPVDLLLKQMNEQHPNLTVSGGMASGAAGESSDILFLNQDKFEHGAVGVLLSGNLRVRTVVSQGCRPIGRHLVVTKSDGNVILEIGGKPALLVLQSVLSEISPADRRLAQRGLHVGQVIREEQEQFKRGDFLIRNITGFDPDSGAIAIGNMVRPGRTIQFHVRDATAASEDLHQLLSAHRGTRLSGGLLFSCNGRGHRFFQRKDHDIAMMQQELGSFPVAGFFAAGEIGPIGGKNFLHGFTASIALFEASSE